MQKRKAPPLPLHVVPQGKTPTGAVPKHANPTLAVPTSGKVLGVPFGSPTSKLAIASSHEKQVAKTSALSGHAEKRAMAVASARAITNIAKKHSSADLVRNATPAGIDVSTGRRVWTSAFSRMPHVQPFQISRNLGISWG